jgi:hypothetical protein
MKLYKILLQCTLTATVPDYKFTFVPISGRTFAPTRIVRLKADGTIAYFEDDAILNADPGGTHSIVYNSAKILAYPEFISVDYNPAGSYLAHNYYTLPGAMDIGDLGTLNLDTNNRKVFVEGYATDFDIVAYRGVFDNVGDPDLSVPVLVRGLPTSEAPAGSAIVDGEVIYPYQFTD